jgi:hypothetical protein
MAAWPAIASCSIQEGKNMRRRVVVLGLVGVIAVLVLTACGGQQSAAGTPEAGVPAGATPATEAVLGGGVRLYCVEACQQNFVYQFNGIDTRNVWGDLATITDDPNARIVMAWVPPDDERPEGRLYIDEQELKTGDGSQEDAAEYFSQYAVVARIFIPEPAADEAPVTSDLSTIQSEAQSIGEIIPFLSGGGMVDSLAELTDAMTTAGNDPNVLTQAQLIVGGPGGGNNSENTLIIFDTEISGPDNALACAQNPSWATRILRCYGRWWR